MGEVVGVEAAADPAGLGASTVQEAGAAQAVE